MSEWYAPTQLLLASAPLAPAFTLFETMSERELVARAQGGDVAAFETLYRTHNARIYALCLRMVANPTRAEDLTQEAFVRAWKKLGTFRGKSAFSTWLHRLAVNLVLGEIRARSRRQDEGVATDELWVVPDPRPARQLETGIDLERSIALLPTQARMVFVLHDVEGFRHAEISERMGIAVGTSKAHLHRARQILREALAS